MNRNRNISTTKGMSFCLPVMLTWLDVDLLFAWWLRKSSQYSLAIQFSFSSYLLCRNIL